MAVNVYVMPYRRFRHGDFTTPLERTFGRDHVTVVGDTRPKDGVPWRLRFSTWRSWRALRRAVCAANGRVAWWKDEGECVYAEQFHDKGLPALRALAIWRLLNESPSGFVHPEDEDYFKHPAWTRLTPGMKSTSHLVACDGYYGFILPVAFVYPVEVEPTRFFFGTISRSVVSAPLLKEELDALAPYVSALSSDTFYMVHNDFEQMREIVDLSLRHALPACFDY